MPEARAKHFRYLDRLVKVLPDGTPIVCERGSGHPGLKKAPKAVRERLVADGWNPARAAGPSDAGGTVAAPDQEAEDR